MGETTKRQLRSRVAKHIYDLFHDQKEPARERAPWNNDVYLQLANKIIDEVLKAGKEEGEPCPGQ